MIFRFLTRKSWKKLKYFLPQDTVRLSCTSSSSRPPATLSWILNDQKVINCKLIPKRWWQWWHRILSNILTFDGYCTLYYILDSCQLSIVHHRDRSEAASLWTEKDPFDIWHQFFFSSSPFACWKVLRWKCQFSLYVFRHVYELKGLFWCLRFDTNFHCCVPLGMDSDRS